MASSSPSTSARTLTMPRRNRASSGEASSGTLPSRPSFGATSATRPEVSGSSFTRWSSTSSSAAANRRRTAAIRRARVSNERRSRGSTGGVDPGSSQGTASSTPASAMGPSSSRSRRTAPVSSARSSALCRPSRGPASFSTTTRPTPVREWAATNSSILSNSRSAATERSTYSMPARRCFASFRSIFLRAWIISRLRRSEGFS